VLVWGAINARFPAPGTQQARFRLDYSGGWGTYRKDTWKTFRNTCRPYTGPSLTWFVAGCTAVRRVFAQRSRQFDKRNFGRARYSHQVAEDECGGGDVTGYGPDLKSKLLQSIDAPAELQQDAQLVPNSFRLRNASDERPEAMIDLALP